MEGEESRSVRDEHEKGGAEGAPKGQAPNAPRSHHQRTACHLHKGWNATAMWGARWGGVLVDGGVAFGPRREGLGES